MFHNWRNWQNAVNLSAKPVGSGNQNKVAAARAIFPIDEADSFE